MSFPDDEFLMSGHRARRVNGWLVGLMVALAAALVFQTLRSREPVFVNHAPRVVTPRGELGADEKATIEVLENASPSVVLIRTKGYQQVFPRGVVERQVSSGTGIVWDENGHIVTNLHVVRDVVEHSRQTSLEVQFSDNRVVDAELIGGVFEFDIAVLKVSPGDINELRPITIGSSDDLQVGQKVLAIGYPFGFDQTLSTGVIGGLNRIVSTERANEFLTGLIQTDAAINPGNSGGPLLDSAGRLIGVNTAIVSPTGAYAGLGFAVPVGAVLDSVTRVVEEASGKQRPELLGASVLSRQSALQLGYTEEIIDRGVIVGRVLQNSAAFDAGLLPGDQITAVDGQPLTSGAELRKVVESHEPGDVIELTIIRGQQTGKLSVPLRARKSFF